MNYICEIFIFILVRILILCTGNSCRSQMAQGFLKSFDSRLEVYSAGTKPVAEVNRLAIKVMAEANIDISHERPEPVDIYLKEEWDYVITVCDEANETCPFFPGKVKHRLHMGFEDPSKAKGRPEHIMNEFRKTRDLIAVSFHKFYTSQIKPYFNEKK